VRTVAELTMGAEPDAVPRARRLVRSALEELPSEVAADAELVVSELVTNASLHGEAPITVRVMVDGCVRVEVEDARRAAPIMSRHNTEAMTGRGLAMVAALSSGWGIDLAGSGGKVVWAELACDGAGGLAASRPEVDIEALLAAWSDGDPAVGTYAVRLGAVSTDLLLSAKAHIDNVVREFTLLREGEASGGAALAPEMAALIQTVTVDFADARAEIKRQAAAAAARGDLITDLELHLTPAAADAGERYLAALDKADRYARSAHLLTLAPPRTHRIFRQWYVQSIVDQLRALARREEPAVPRPFQVVLTEEVTKLAEAADAMERLALLQKVTAELADARSAQEMSQIVVDNAVQFLGVESARVRLLTDDAMLRSVARRGWGDQEPERFPEYPLDADLPGAEAARTGRPVYMHSLQETFDRHPALVGHYRAGRSGHVTPLTVHQEVLGVLSLTFLSGELTDEAEVAVVESLADALAQGLRRAQLAASDEEKRETLSLLAGATQIMVTAREPSEVLERLVALAVPRLGDWCTVYLVDGPVLRRAAMAIDGQPELAEQLKALPLSLEVDSPHARAFRTGKPQLVSEGAGHILEGLYPGLDFSALGGDPYVGTGICVPINLRGERIGTIGLTFVNSHRKVTPHVVEALSGLRDRAAIAFDSARRWSAQRQVVRMLVGALLPELPPEVAGMAFAARYLPAGGDVAGDWWEAQLMPDGTVLVGLGDAAGHGLSAVSRMSELRHGARALAVVEPSPAALLADLNRYLTGADAGFATAVYGRLEPATGELCWASAGHVPPMHVTADGKVSVLGDTAGTPLGVPMTGPGRDHVLALRPGETLVLYSDGVVESRHGQLDDGIRRLAGTVAGHAHEDLETLADSIIDVHCPRPVDDCCLLLLRRRGD
jgi:GAF domain-containing protein/anti-sigma regulatory factor (Ser/Thr protein kinase)